MAHEVNSETLPAPRRVPKALTALALSAASFGAGFGVCKVTSPASTAPVSVHFSPPRGATQAIVNAITHAESEILIQAYVFNSWRVRDSLIEVRQRNPNVKIALILDRTMMDQSMPVARQLSQAGVEIRIDNAHEGGCAHNKILVIDKRLVVTGSFNLTFAAETRNAENLLLVTDPALAARYRENWEAHWNHSAPFENHLE